MKTLILCRHAKSSWKYATEDCYRPLNQRGLMQAPEMASHSQQAPDMVLCSPAVRAWSTAVCYFQAQRWDYQCLRMEPRLIEASRDNLVAILRELSDDITRLYLFGHNPGFNDLIDWLCPGKGKPVNLVTSGRVEISLALGHWRLLAPDVGVIQDWRVPHKSTDK
ncbi:SixA phosphatase family protein [Planctobacterium marinum]|uniref:SixA phosphatase family protein n=1 Tax=Planctobacterium marinum TaxID=1631968 RepID=UPI001E3D1EF6|nr:histidine phosphatase family protein [Planctobacterium marinum]MCC2604208.1 histidine phosphatase family protein [Planctobacterium marinum]